jgi:hypothetical protein
MKYVSDLILDNGIAYLKANGTEEYLCTSQPADRAAAIAASVASKTGLTSGDYTGPSDGAVSGRKMTVNAQAGIVASADGTATHIAICSGTTLLLVTTVTSQVVTNGNTVNLPAFSDEMRDVTP